MSYSPDFWIAGKCSAISYAVVSMIPSLAKIPAPRIARPILAGIASVDGGQSEHKLR